MSIQTVELGEIYNGEYNLIKDSLPFHYAELNAKYNNTSYEIKKIYHKLALKYHPDKCTDINKDKYTIKFQKIKNAYKCLSDEKSRNIYDKQMQTIKKILPLLRFIILGYSAIKVTLFTSIFVVLPTYLTIKTGKLLLSYIF